MNASTDRLAYINSFVTLKNYKLNRNEAFAVPYYQKLV